MERSRADEGLRHPEPLSPCHPVIFLIGPRGSGKSTVAALLARHLGWAWADADVVLEERAGCSVRELFARQGEAAFRDLEAAVLAELCGRKETVIATGGGVVLRPENREQLRRTGAVVWLRASPETLWSRIDLDPATGERRPNLGVGGVEEVRQLVAAREALYRECAHHAVVTEGRTAEEIAREVAGWWAGHLNP